MAIDPRVDRIHRTWRTSTDDPNLQLDVAAVFRQLTVRREATSSPSQTFSEDLGDLILALQELHRLIAESEGGDGAV